MLSKPHGLALAGAIAFAGTLLQASSGFAQTSPQTGTMTVSASVVQACTLGTINPLNFGVYAPGADKLAETTFQVDCNLAGTVSIALNDGLNGVSAGRQMKNGGEGPNHLIRYNLYSDSARTSQWRGAAVTKNVTAGPDTFNIYGTIAGSLSPNAAVGNYTDTVTVTLTF